MITMTYHGIFLPLRNADCGKFCFVPSCDKRQDLGKFEVVEN